ncbi:biotin transporter BioY [Zafaria cholistanensis]|uniref:Biotin transporter n=1 Tax=Zafaria cholistanensis TaxID=1682741 RepID=A0A5A7NM65_9MICC|nr:biotin transporter BioY [Zafaria cholistanensis]GER22044.1 biotin transporter BioY [Zafaria cholistanensis]
MTRTIPAAERGASSRAAHPRTGPGPRDLALIAVFAALIAALTLVPAIPVGPLGVPITLQTLGVAVAALVLGSLRGFCAVALYLLVGLAGVPVFAKFSGGLGVLAGPSAGYLLAFPLAALLAGALATVALRRARRFRMLWLFLSASAGSILVLHPLGILGMSINAQLPLAQAAVYDLAYWPGDLVKNLLAAAIAVAVFKAFPRLARRDFRG